MTKLTKAQRATLEWFGNQPRPACDFSSAGPTLNMRRWGLRLGYLATYVDGGMYYWVLTDAGRAALEQGGQS